jgi:hypothetical protein
MTLFSLWLKNFLASMFCCIPLQSCGILRFQSTKLEEWVIVVVVVVVAAAASM